MTPDLGKYAFEVLAAYGATIGLIVVLIALSLMRARKVRRALTEVEERRRKDG